LKNGKKTHVHFYLVYIHRDHSIPLAFLMPWKPVYSNSQAGKPSSGSLQDYTHNGSGVDSIHREEHSLQSGWNLLDSEEKTGLHSGPWSNQVSLLKGREKSACLKCQ